MSHTIKKILIVRPDVLGDVIFTLPLINTLAKHYPNSEIYILAQSYTKELLSDHPPISGVILNWNKESYSNHTQGYLDYCQKIKSFEFDMVVFPYLDRFYARLMAEIDIPIRIGDSEQKDSASYLTHASPRRVRNLSLHEVEQNIGLLKGWDVSIEPSYEFNLQVTKKEESVVNELLEENGWKGEPYICVHPSIGKGNKVWDKKKYAEMMDVVYHELGLTTVVTGSSENLNDHQEIISYCKTSPINMTGKTTLTGLKVLISGAKIMVGGQTGPVHMASALGIPVLSLATTKFIKSLRWGPFGVPHKILGAQRKCIKLCQPYRSLCGGVGCDDGIKVSDAIDSIQTLIERPQLYKEEDAKISRFITSGKVAIYLMYVHADINDILLHYTKTLDIEGCKYHIICSTKKGKTILEKVINTPVHVIKPWNMIEWVNVIKSEDIIVIHFLRKTMWRRLVWLWTQISAIYIYVPPVTTYFCDKELTRKSIVLKYLNSFK